MQVAFQILRVLGSLGVFLYGMRLMSEGLQQAAGSRLKRVLGYMTTNRFAGVLSGFGITAVIQSSSAATVMVVGFVDAGLLSLRQAIGVIMGANIGTTVTGWIVALLGFKFSITSAALPAIAVGMAILLIKKIDRDDLGEMLLGFGLLFLGLGLLKDSVPDIRENPQVLEFLTNFTGLRFASFLVFVFAGTILTIIVQSSSAAMAITLTMTFSGWIDYPTAAAIILGENIGTTVTAYIAALNAGPNARRAARAHTLFNIFGVLWMAILFQPFLRFVDVIVPGEITGRIETTAHLAMFHSLFNIVNTILCIGFVKRIERLVNRLVKERATDATKTYHFSYVKSQLQDTPEFHVLAAQGETAKLAALTEELFSYFLELFYNPKKSIRAQRREYRDKLELSSEMQEQITAYLVESSREAMSEGTANTLNRLVRIVTELDSVADTCGKLIRLAERKYEKDVKLETDFIEALVPYCEMVSAFLKFNKGHVAGTLNDTELETARDIEEHINARQKELKKAAQKRIRRGGSVKAELFYIDVLRHIEHIGDFSLAISEALAKTRV